ncbi:MAG: disulfide bond formation protein B [Pacificimonas sp.]
MRAALLIVLFVPTALLSGALVGQHVFGLPPCEMCMWQRWPHVAALVLASLALLIEGARRPLVVVAALAIAVSGAIGAFHAGVEYGWWEGVTPCATTSIATGGDFLAEIAAQPLVRCDVAPWSLFGISLAGYNALISILASGAALWLTLRTK